MAYGLLPKKHLYPNWAEVLFNLLSPLTLELDLNMTLYRDIATLSLFYKMLIFL
jgi:hypothetical protein